MGFGDRVYPSQGNWTASKGSVFSLLVKFPRCLIAFPDLPGLQVSGNEPLAHDGLKDLG